MQGFTKRYLPSAALAALLAVHVAAGQDRAELDTAGAATASRSAAIFDHIAPGQIVPVPEGARIVTHDFATATSRADGGPWPTDKLIYSNTRARFIFKPGAGFRISDDIITVAVTACNVTSLKIRVSGGADGDGEFSVKVSLYDKCPPSGGSPLLDTVCDDGPMVNVACADDLDCTGGARCRPVVVFEDLDDDSLLLHDLFLPMPALPRVLPPAFWVQAEFSTSTAGWLFGSRPTQGFTDDRYAHPFTGCSGFTENTPAFPWAGFFVEVFAEPACDTHFLAYMAASPSAGTFVAPGGAATRVADDVRLIVNNCELSAIDVGMRGTKGEYEMVVDVRTFPTAPPIPGTERVFLGEGLGSVEVQRFVYDENIFPSDPSGTFYVTWKASRGGTGVLNVGRTLAGEGQSTYWLENAPGFQGWHEFDRISGRFAIFHLAVYCRGEPPKGACCPLHRAGATEVDCFDDASTVACLPFVCGVATECEGARWLQGAVCGSGEDDPFDPPCGTHACCGPDQRCQGGGNHGSLCSNDLACDGGVCVTGRNGSNCSDLFFGECEAITDFRENERPCVFDFDCPGRRRCELSGLCEPKRARWSSGEFCGDVGFRCWYFACLDAEGDCLNSAGDPFDQPPCSSFLDCEPGKRCLFPPGSTTGLCESRLGCGSLTCCDAVCSSGESGRFCCEVGWDRTCAGNSLAGFLCPQAPGNDFCFHPNDARGAIELIPNAECVVADNGHATADDNDPGYCCHNAGPGQHAWGTLWFWFEATDSSARIHTCDTPASETATDSLIQVFKVEEPDRGLCADDAAPCSVSMDNCPGGNGLGLCRLDEEAACQAISTNPLTVIGCNDDSPGCGTGTDANSDVCVSGLIPGARYYVVLGSSRNDTQGIYTLCLESPCPDPPAPGESGLPDVCVPKTQMTAAVPACDETLPRTQNNHILIEFSGDITTPVSGEIEIRELLPASTFGADLSASFTFTVQNGNELIIRETGNVLSNNTWYTIIGTSGWIDVSPFEIDYAVVYGDVSNSGATDVTDVTQVLANRVDPSPVDSRFDVNGSGAVDVTDLSIAMSHRGSTAPPKPNGHLCLPAKGG